MNVRGFLLGVLLFSAWHEPASAQRFAERPLSANVIVPQARAFGFGRSPAIRITGITAGVVIRDVVAVTMLEIRLQNPGSARQEAELLVPVPAGAIVREFSFQGGGSEPSAQLLPRDEARAIYDRIVAQSRDPALLEFAGLNLVRSSVFPVEPGGTQAVRLTYEHILESNGDRVDYVLPRTESLEYTVPWKVAVKISSTTPIAAIYSSSHRVNTARPAPATAAVELSHDAGNDPGPFRLSFLRRRSDLSATLFAYPDPRVGGGYFLLLAGLPPGATDAVPASGLRREVTLVIDRSGSMRGEKLAQVREAALQVLAGLDDEETFNVILYNEGVEPFADRPVRKSRATLREATEFLERMTPRGGTNIHDALLEALRQPTSPGALPIVLFMTDGLPTVGPTSEAVIRDLARTGNSHHRRIFTFGVGVDVNTPLLEKLAYESRATTTFVLPGENVEVKVAAVFNRLRGPVLADAVLSINDPGGRRRTRDLIPARLPDVFEGDQIVVLGQYTGDDPLDFALRGNYRGTPRTFTFRLSLDQATTRNGFVPRLWAGRKIGLLIDAIREQGASNSPRSPGEGPRSAPRELVDEIIRLSTEFGILTEYTAFLAREGTDFSQKDKVVLEAESLLRSRAMRTRSGLSSLNQDVNNQYQKSIATANPRNSYRDESMNEVSTNAVQQAGDRAFYKRRDRWVDSRLVATESEVLPKRTIVFGTEEFRELAARLAREGRQGTITLRGDTLMLIDGQPVLIQAPVDQP